MIFTDVHNCDSKQYKIKFNVFLNHLSNNVTILMGNASCSIPVDNTMVVSYKITPNISKSCDLF